MVFLFPVSYNDVSLVVHSTFLTLFNTITIRYGKFYMLSTEALIPVYDCLRDKYHVLPIGHPVHIIMLLELSISLLFTPYKI